MKLTIPYAARDGHPMKPVRLALTHALVMAYGMHKNMMCFRPRPALADEIAAFHGDDYVDFLQRVSPDNAEALSKAMARFNLGVDDCPIFSGLFDFSALCAGASLEAARKLISGVTDTAINWSGGLHHAKKWGASGFCYVNDIILAILELLRAFPRVVYIDIDVHHGDGVQEAFYQSNRVMTVSFHRYDSVFFPGTGSIDERGTGRGKDYSINVPLESDMNDEAFSYIFRGVVGDVVRHFSPSVIVFQCGADSLAADRLGCFNLSIKGHGACVSYVKSLGIPLLVLGGGGYTIRNVSRAWAYETSILCNLDLDPIIPDNPYIQYYAPKYCLHPQIADTALKSPVTRSQLDSLRVSIAESLRATEFSPSVQLQEIPPGLTSFHDYNVWEMDFCEEKS